MNFNDTVKHAVQHILRDASKNMSGAFISEIHPDINIKYNSVNVIVGKQGQGKTVIALQEIIKIAIINSQMRESPMSSSLNTDCTYHLLIYVTKDGKETDRTFIALKPLIEPYIPILCVSEDNAQKVIDDIIKTKNEYYRIKNNNLEDKLDDPNLKITPDEINSILDTLHIDDFSYKYLHTIILFDDISNNKLFANETSYFSQLIRRCRHTNMSFFLLIQGWKGLKTHIKNEITTLFIFPCFNKQQLHYIYSQSASNMSFDEFYEEYSKILQLKTQYPQSHPYMVVQVSDGGETFVEV